MNNTSDTLTQKLHARADKKLQEYCIQRFGGLFKECGGHTTYDRPDIKEYPRLEQMLHALGSSKNEFPWHGTVWEIAAETLFGMLRDKWREREVSEFIAKVEDVNSIWEGGDA